MPSWTDQRIIDCYMAGDEEDLRLEAARDGSGAALDERAKALGLTKDFIKKCRLSGTRAALRECMKCDAEFLSWGLQNRLCRRCSSR